MRPGDLFPAVDVLRDVKDLAGVRWEAPQAAELKHEVIE